MNDVVYAVPTGTMINLAKKATKNQLPLRHHGFIVACKPGGTAYVVRQVKTSYGGAFEFVYPVTGKDPARGGMLQRRWLSVREEDLPRLKRVAKPVTLDTVRALKSHVTDYQQLNYRGGAS